MHLYFLNYYEFTFGIDIFHTTNFWKHLLDIFSLQASKSWKTAFKL